MKIIVRYHPEFIVDYRSFPELTRRLIDNAIEKVCKNPLSEDEGGVGRAIAASSNNSILVVRTETEGVSVVYKLIRSKEGSNLLVVFAAAQGDSVHMPKYK